LYQANFPTNGNSESGLRLPAKLLVDAQRARGVFEARSSSAAGGEVQAQQYAQIHGDSLQAAVRIEL
jgi:hypothetical protein